MAVASKNTALIQKDPALQADSAVVKEAGIGGNMHMPRR